MKPGCVLMIVHSYCPSDPRVRREAEALAEAGMSVDVLCLRGPGQSASETVGGVRYIRLPVRRRRGGTLRYVFEYSALVVSAWIAIVPLHLSRRYSVVQAHNMPDFLVYAGFFPWLCGASVVLDLHDPVPELYQAKFDLEKRAPLIRVLTAIERAAIAFADRVFAATGAFRDRLVERGHPAERLDVLLNSPDPKLFAPRARDARASAPLELLFHGTVTERSGVDLAILAAEEVRRRGVDLRFVVLGDGDFLPQVRALIAEKGRSTWIELRDPLPIEDVPSVVASCDLGVIPNRPGPFHDLALPTRLFESLEMERPVVVARSPAIRALFLEGDIFEFEAGDVEDLARVLEKACRDPEARRSCVELGRRVARLHAWELEKRAYVDTIDALRGRDRPVARER